MANRDEGNDIPSINITVEVPSTPTHMASSLSPTSGGFLSPSSYPYGPPSPTPSELSESSSVPPSPTLSNHSGLFPTSLHLRDNKPEESTGLSSLGLLNPGSPHTHQRKGSNATSMTDVESDLRHVSSTTTSFTKFDLHSPSPSEKHPNDAESEHKADEEQKKGKKKKGKKDDKDAEPTLTAHQLELSQDQAIDPRPFRFKPFQLAHILDPKNFEALQSFGGIEGLLRGLGTDSEHGLSSKDSSSRSGAHHEKGHLHHHAESRKSADLPKHLPEIVLTEPSGNVGSPTEADDGAAFQATMDDRRRVFGENLLPTRISKTLLQLMWAALKDKVLVRFLYLFTYLVFLPLCVDLTLNCRRRLSCPRLLPGLWHQTPARRTPGRLGGRCRDHDRDCNCCKSLFSVSILKSL